MKTFPLSVCNIILDAAKLIAWFVGLAMAIGGFFGIALWAGATAMRLMGIEVNP